VRFEASAICLSWIPPQAVEGMFKIPFSLGVAHYDAPPPDSSPDVDALLAADAIRFANDLRGWVEVDDDGRIVDCGMSGRGRLGSTTMRLRSRGMTFAGVALPEITEPPTVESEKTTFVQTAGGHTGVGVPRAVPDPPFWRLTAPLAWSTISLTLHADGSSESTIADASPFPRHYLYDTRGRLTHKSALIGYKNWLRRSNEQHSPWSGKHPSIPLAAVSSEVERAVADAVLVSGSHSEHRLPSGRLLSDRPIAETEVHVLLDGLLVIEMDGNPVSEVGPGAIFDPTLRSPESKQHVSVRARTPCRLAVLPREELDQESLLQVAVEQTKRLQRSTEQPN
jgi:hypothetical protein